MPLKMFDTVTVVCDPVTFEHGNAIRAVLEVYRLQVHLVQLIQRRQAEAFFANPDPSCRYTVLDAHGSNKPPGTGIHISVVDQKDGDEQAAEGWDDSPLLLTAITVPKIVKGNGTLISLACGSGNPSLTSAFLDAGYDAYIAPTGDQRYPDADAAALFAAGFFYFAMSGDRDYETASYTDDEATSRAADIDAAHIYGTGLFRRHCRNQSRHPCGGQ